MKEILIATTNPAKVDQIRGALSALDIDVIGIEDKSVLPEVVEDGETAVENAHKKALAFARSLGKTVLSMDNSLYFDALDGDERQPRLNVRRVSNTNNHLSDEEIIAYYSELISSLGGEAKARWEYGVCVSTPEGKSQETTFGYQTVFVSKPSSKIMEGYPLESLQINLNTGVYRSEMSKDDLSKFWQQKIGEPLSQFVSSLKL